ncbi:DUF2913 family protein [Serratia ficaria]|uniref:DUF2913 family protein n=1 Tax=Serratia ficaria TaxID=61651 RepID=UPI00217AFEC8|nr:DUF2913 family protein [Serratia ficaria]CAI1225801.1 Protein of uncharacterised function (DUF2913) [Serratia ficaria]CAI2486757.1 Protein of uncharacterised function (DUF2913) [Serratia ficaria]CAI2533425.1 Protein of uncharacterised function (DUF2913) [Serratia ficaria]CAI2538279.1 Protein of uncharacterised function (DUF2913) [Serratia ficaria]CAI2538690.1 Protein of uncharacterised function (DUF2913) [Serratia ficaria]
MTVTQTEKAAHLAWCALVALGIARQDGTLTSPAQENLFLTRWLATALKQRRFSRDVTPDIEWLLKQGRLQGVRAKLPGKLDYLWRSCTGELMAQNDLFRLTYALETAKEMQWQYRLLSDREWSGRHAVALSDAVNGVYLLKASLDASFDEDGNQTGPLLARITGSVEGMVALLSTCGWQAVAEDEALPRQYRLTAGQEKR